MCHIGSNSLCGAGARFKVRNYAYIYIKFIFGETMNSAKATSEVEINDKILIIFVY